jgi:hypothetical protein
MLQAVTSAHARCLTSLTSLAYGTDVHGLALPLQTPDKTAASVNNVVGDVVTNKQLSSDNATDDISNGKSTTGRGVETFEIN